MNRRYVAVFVLVLLATPVQDEIEQASEKKSPFNETVQATEKKSPFSGVWCVTKKYGWAVVMGVGVVFVERLAIVFSPIGMSVWHGGVVSVGASAGLNFGNNGAFSNLQSIGASVWPGLKPVIRYRGWLMSMYKYIMGSCSENDMDCDAESEKSTEWTSDDVWCLAKKVGGSLVVGTGAVALAPVALGAVSFGSAGVIAGSTAAKIMTGLAASNGVGVAAGSLFAPFQSAGAAGLAVGTKVTIGTSVGGMFGYFSGGCSDNDIDCKNK